MIISLNIQNVALIEAAEINFHSGLNVLSGETGAGKSVILDSVNFVLGAKADKSMIRHGQNECSVCATFDISNNNAVKDELSAMDIEWDDELIVYRKFTLDGRSTIKINGISANASMLKRLTAQLVDVHGQSEHFFLLKEKNQLKVLDDVVGCALSDLKTTLSQELKQLKGYNERLNTLGADDAGRSRRIDVLAFQIEEIQNAELKEDEEDELLAERKKMNSVQKITLALQQAEQALNGESAAIDALRTAKKSVGSVTELDGEYQAVYERLENLQAEAEDIAQTVESLAEDVYFDENRLQSIEKRLDEIKMLKRKYGNSVGEIEAFLQKAREEYDLLVHSDEEIEKLNKNIVACRQKIYRLCRQITALRTAAANDFATRVIAELKTLNIPSAQFEVAFNDYGEQDAERATHEGMDEICFLFSANAGEPVKPLSKIISGGEMSRFMLAIKTQLSAINNISTYIFDEIDAGISGQTAKVVAEKFAKIAQNTQIIAVSHLAQIAGMADEQFLIEKKEREGKTTTEVLLLSEQGRLRELVRLLGGDEGSEYAEKHALELIDTAKNYKNILSQNQ